MRRVFRANGHDEAASLGGYSWVTPSGATLVAGRFYVLEDYTSDKDRVRQRVVSEGFDTREAAVAGMSEEQR